MPVRKDLKTVLVLGSGPIKIGQAAEFDYSGTQACLALKEEGMKVILINNNPATIMTDPVMADEVYIEPMDVHTVTKVIEKEKPDGILPTLGGQTALNLLIDLKNTGVLDRYTVEVLGTSVDNIERGEDRDLFRDLMLQLSEPIPVSTRVHKIEEADEFSKTVGFPLIIRPAYTLGGEGGGIAYTHEDLAQIVRSGLHASPINQVLIEESILGWKEIEYEVLRDANDTCTIVCNMENVDPVGIHTGDSIVVAPSQTLSDRQYQLLREASIKVIRALNIVGGCNIQFGLDPQSDAYKVIEVNPRVSRSSALASKATGFPIARIATKCAIGYHLDEIENPITEKTFAAFEPALDYIVVKLPRFPFDKFKEGNRTLNTQMKATGEVMAMDRTFEGALNKAIRSLDLHQHSLTSTRFHHLSNEQLMRSITNPTDERIFLLAEAFNRGYPVEELHAISSIDPWFLYKMSAIVTLENRVKETAVLSVAELWELKRFNISDQWIADCLKMFLHEFRAFRKSVGVLPGYKQVDTCAGEFEAVTPYYYSTWTGSDEVVHDSRDKALVLGSGPIRIGQGIEFDYCSVHAAKALKASGYTTIVMNNNPETVSTDYSVADRLYFEPLALEDVLSVIEKEKINLVFIQFGGQTAINLAAQLEEHGVNIAGTPVKAISGMEDRNRFYQILKRLDLPAIEGSFAKNVGDMEEIIDDLSFPLMVRPSYVIGGESMHILRSSDDVRAYIKQLQLSSDRVWPMILDQYIDGRECELDAICDGEDVIIPGIFEHIERAGVHSGDSTAIFPPLTLTEEEKSKMIEMTKKLTKDQGIVGMVNIQFVIDGGTVYPLEVNPRASRTVPVLSKVTGIPIIDWAVQAQLGIPLKDVHDRMELLEEPPFFSVKAPAFSNGKLGNVDHFLGPEMKSTGEILGLSYTKEDALAKSITAAQTEGGILCSFSSLDHTDQLQDLQRFVKQGINLYGTPGTSDYMEKLGLPIQRVSRDVKEIEALMEQGCINMVYCTPTKGRDKLRTGFQIRALATKFGLPCWTHIDQLSRMQLKTSVREQEVTSLQTYHQSSEKVVTK
ncbi:MULTISPECIES: carbamoyl-phosphate synthase (glutamine-hydrolyzing) large subunit [Pontibacillus]|uniref:Carbamoyl phosphate synthase large chain n=1 Tax=Pontibacillus chungwhensis TaxID=265426 RepID=A0ABY8UUW8_9BACI|nr:MULTISPECIES: carbamoyl-phosphate synthase (glutamine-hydrolyzing) large subunit [Pontibacillus]MCD5323444.1 carbamoyl-phosphate synthase (glutamine-hydrolyzing) large subunit [Pontibacillus sp. HN14]WIF96822.1 carbamoyl-phosphate synthase (glutamine-hydrolyzing) large subunit [Pontibacillus chungwhensis]